MLRPDLTPSPPPEDISPDINGQAIDQTAPVSEAGRRLDIQQSLNVLEELILESPRLWPTRRTLVDEDKLLEQLDRIRLNLPSIFQEASQIVRQREAIAREAEAHAQRLVYEANQEAARRLDNLGIVQQAEAEALRVKQQLQQECDALKAQTLAEIEHWQQAAQQSWGQMKAQTELECQGLKQDADTYAGQMLERLEHQLTDMLTVVYNGRQALQVTDIVPAQTGDRPSAPTPSSYPKALPQSPPPQGNRWRRRTG